jgi:hypothetical protein
VEARKPEKKVAASKKPRTRRPKGRSRSPSPRSRAAAAAHAEARAPGAREDGRLDNDKEVEPPPDAQYLAQKNNRVTSKPAPPTNLQKAQKGGRGGVDKSDRTIRAGADKQKIAELEDKKSALGRKAPTSRPTTTGGRAAGQGRRLKSPLRCAIRPRSQHELTPETVDLSLPHAADGESRSRARRCAAPTAIRRARRTATASSWRCPTGT